MRRQALKMRKVIAVSFRMKLARSHDRVTAMLLPGPVVADQFGLEQRVERLGHRVDMRLTGESKLGSVGCPWPRTSCLLLGIGDLAGGSRIISYSYKPATAAIAQVDRSRREPVGPVSIQGNDIGPGTTLDPLLPARGQEREHVLGADLLRR